MGVPVNTLLQVQIRSRVNTQRLLNVLHWRNVTQSSVATISSEYDEIWSMINGSGVGQLNLVALLRPCLSTDVTIDEVRLQFVRPIRYVHKPFTVALSGTFAAACPVQNIQATIVKSGERAGKHYRGAVRLGGLGSSAYSGGLLTVGFRTTMANFASTIKAPFSTAGNATWHARIFNRITQTWQNDSAEFTESLVKEEVRTQRTRTVGRGE